jgi:pimeloyl-ACP methyl ester carboxylesterase
VTAPSPPLAHRIEGEGPPVVLLNGGMMTFGSWKPVAERLVARYRVLGFDFRGPLLSPGRPPATFAGHAADVAALLDRIGWSSAHLVGTSFGALVATAFAAEWPTRVRSLILITAMDRATPELSRQTAELRAAVTRALEGDDRGEVYDLLVEGAYSSEFRRRAGGLLAERRARTAELPLDWFSGLDGLLRVVERFDLSSAAASWRGPALAVIAGDDRVMDEPQARAFAASLGAEVERHPTAGHALVIEQPQGLAEIVLRFLDRVSAGGRGSSLGAVPEAKG